MARRRRKETAARTPPRSGAAPVPPRAPLALELLAVLALAAAGMLATWGHVKDDSPTSDETYHLYAGAEYVERGTYFLNLEHPPLMKALAAWALHPLELRPPSFAGLPPGRPVDPNDYYAWLYKNGVSADELVARGRR